MEDDEEDEDEDEDEDDEDEDEEGSEEDNNEAEWFYSFPLLKFYIRHEDEPAAPGITGLPRCMFACSLPRWICLTSMTKLNAPCISLPNRAAFAKNSSTSHQPCCYMSLTGL